MKDNLNANDSEFIKGSNININEIPLNIFGNPPPIYNPPLFQTDILIQFFQNKRIIITNCVCPICGHICKLETKSDAIDRKMWRCRGRNHYE